MKKETIRSQIQQFLSGLSPVQKRIRDREIYNKVRLLPEFQKSRYVFSFVSQPQEPDTRKLIRYCLRSGKKVFIPAVNKQNYSLSIYEITDMKSLVKGQYNIQEPDRKILSPSRRRRFDILFIPGIAFDPGKNRLGRGKGYFDRFLKSCRGIKAGLCYKEQILPRIPVKSHDIKMDLLIKG